MLVSHTSPSLIEDILLPDYWSPRTTFWTNFQERITPVADRWKLPSRDYRQRILRSSKILSLLRSFSAAMKSGAH